MNTKYKRWLRRFLLTSISLLTIYIVFFEVQSHLGRQALEATGLQSVELNQALKQAQQQKRYVLVDFAAIWCPTCRKLDQKVFSVPEVQAVIEQHYIFSRVEYETAAGKAFMKQHGIKGFPSLLILDADGNKLLNLPLTFDPELFIDYLEDFLEMKKLS